MNGYSNRLRQMGIDYLSVFQQTMNYELYGACFFETLEKHYFDFRNDKTGDTVWLVPVSGSDQQYSIKVVEKKVILEGKLVAQPILFDQQEPFSFELLEDRKKENVEERIRRCAKLLAAQINLAFIEVLRASVKEISRISVTDQPLGEVMAQGFSDFTKKHFHLNRFVFPRHLKAKLVANGLIEPNDTFNNAHYVGTTITGQEAFWSEELPNDTALMFDSSFGVNLSEALRVEIGSLGAFRPAVLGFAGMNPIIKNAASVMELYNLEQALGKGKPTMPIGDEQYVDTDRLHQLQSIHSKDFDLTNLVEFCVELNTCYSSKCYLAIPMLVRAIMDHIPPIFCYEKFCEVANNYGGGGKSFRETMQYLDNSTRKIADSFLHRPIRSKEELPTRTEIDFRAQLGALLREICRILK